MNANAEPNEPSLPENPYEEGVGVVFDLSKLRITLEEDAYIALDVDSLRKAPSGRGYIATIRQQGIFHERVYFVPAVPVEVGGGNDEALDQKFERLHEEIREFCISRLGTGISLSLRFDG